MEAPKLVNCAHIYDSYIFGVAAQFVGVGAVDDPGCGRLVGQASFVAELQFLRDRFSYDGEDEPVDLQHQMRQRQQQQSVNGIGRCFIPP